MDNQKQKKSLKDKLNNTGNYIKRNALKPIPFVGWIDYINKGFEKDEPEIGILKYMTHLLYTGTVIGLTAVSIMNAQENTQNEKLFKEKTNYYNKHTIEGYTNKNTERDYKSQSKNYYLWK